VWGAPRSGCWAGGLAQEVECLPSKHEALNSSPHTEKKKNVGANTTQVVACADQTAGSGKDQPQVHPHHFQVWLLLLPDYGEESTHGNISERQIAKEEAT
jgi:hypothetical protein